MIRKAEQKTAEKSRKLVKYVGMKISSYENAKTEVLRSDNQIWDISVS